MSNLIALSFASLPFVEGAQTDPLYKPGAAAKVADALRVALAPYGGDSPDTIPSEDLIHASFNALPYVEDAEFDASYPSGAAKRAAAALSAALAPYNSSSSRLAIAA